MSYFIVCFHCHLEKEYTYLCFLCNQININTEMPLNIPNGHVPLIPWPV
jgi:hypothetical protein